MAYLFLLLGFFLSPHLVAQPTAAAPIKRTLKVRKKTKIVPFEYALSMPATATSCDCPEGTSSAILAKLGCQHPDTAAICKVVVTQFDVAILAPRQAPVIIKNVKGSFLTNYIQETLQHPNYQEAFVSYSNIEGLTSDGKAVVVPSFGSTATQQRAQRLYRSVYSFLPTIDSTHTTIRSFELLAYDTYGRMIFKQSYDKDGFDINAIRPDAARYVFKQIKAQHKSGFYVEVRPVAYESLDIPVLDLLSTTN
jgi:hypothetical protein